MWNIHVKFGQAAKEMLFKRLFLALAAIWSVVLKHLCNFHGGKYGEHSYKIILNLDNWI